MAGKYFFRINTLIQWRLIIYAFDYDVLIGSISNETSFDFPIWKCSIYNFRESGRRVSPILWIIHETAEL